MLLKRLLRILRLLLLLRGRNLRPWPALKPDQLLELGLLIHNVFQVGDGIPVPGIPGTGIQAPEFKPMIGSPVVLTS